MTRFAWLQARTQTLGMLGALTLLAAVAAVTGVQMSHLYADLVAPCQSHGSCGLAVDDFLSHQQLLQRLLDPLMLIFPALIGAFWGAPLLSRELETGTYRLAWTQSVSRRRWLLTRIGMLAAATVLVTGVLTLTVTWWYRSVDATQSSRYAFFERRDLVPVAYAVFAFAVGALAGAVVRRTVPAMAATIAVFAAVRITFMHWMRPHLLSPMHLTASLLSSDQFGFESSNGAAPALVAKGGGPQGSWTIASRLVSGSGHTATLADRVAFVKQYCPKVAAPPTLPPGSGIRKMEAPPDMVAALQTCRQQAAHTFHLVVSYQPASRYWTLQWMEAGIFVALAAVLLAGCYLWVTRRVR